VSKKKETSLYTFSAKAVNKMKVLGKIPATTVYVEKLLGFRGFASVCESSLLRKRRQKMREHGKEKVGVSKGNTLM
jgi:hypothetical protein